jgi:putative hydrolase of the HAD superfamily
MPPAGLDTVFLDAGNTLIGMDSALLASLAAATGIRTTADAVARAEAAARPALSARLAAGRSSETGSTFRFYIEQMLAQLGVEPDERSALTPRLANAVKRVPTVELWSHVLPGVPAALGALRAAGLRLVVVSNADGTVEDGLTHAGLRPLVDAVIDSTRVGFEKPDPRIFQCALAKAGTTADRAVHVGDLYSVDVLGARSCGIGAALLDPYGDWPALDCDVYADLAAFTRALI